MDKEPDVLWNVLKNYSDDEIREALEKMWDKYTLFPNAAKKRGWKYENKKGLF